MVSFVKEQSDLMDFMDESGLTEIKRIDKSEFKARYKGEEVYCKTYNRFNLLNIYVRPLDNSKDIGNGCGGLILFEKPQNSLPIEDTTTLSPNEVINLYRKAYREGYLTPSMFLEKLNELVKEKIKE